MNRAVKPGFAPTILAALLAVTGFWPATPARTSESMLDSLEWKLELYRHEKLADIKHNQDNTLAPFTTDGCSGGLSIGWNHLAAAVEHIKEIHGDSPPWDDCCVTHDRAYHTAGPRACSPEDSFRARKTADEQLRQCVIDTAAQRAPELSDAYGLSPEEVTRIYSVIGSLMYRAVRLGGVPCSGLPWRWGYGWPECE